MSPALDRAPWRKATRSRSRGNAPLRLDSPCRALVRRAAATPRSSRCRGGEGPRTHLCLGGSRRAALRRPTGGRRRPGWGSSPWGPPARACGGSPRTAAPGAGPRSGGGGRPRGPARRAGWPGSSAGSPAPPAPRLFEELRPGAEVRLAEAGRAARTAGGGCLGAPRGGELRLLGEAELALSAGDLFPVPEGLWLVGAGEARIPATRNPRPPGRRRGCGGGSPASTSSACATSPSRPSRLRASGPRAPRAPAGPRPLQPAERLRAAGLGPPAGGAAAPLRETPPTRSSPPASWSAGRRGSPCAPAPTRRPAASWRTASPGSAPPPGSAPAG